jgi:two-component system, sensor histidine kinase and response regulator
VEVGAVADQIVTEFAERANDKGLTLTAQCEGVSVLGHRDMLLVILRNLVGNAVKFTLPGGFIRIAAMADENKGEVSISDTGVGMSPDQIAGLFKVDRRLSTIGTAGEPGSGLGLLLCRDLVELQNGRLTLYSTASEGTTFRFALTSASQIETWPSAQHRNS